jgi:hypothetical protein
MKKFEYAVCMPRRLPQSKLVAAAMTAAEHNPANVPPVRPMGMLGLAPNKMSIAILTTKYWGAKGIKLTVGFMDNPEKALRDRILSHMNAWSKTANIGFKYTKVDPQVRIARVAGGGHWSYTGTDVLHIDKNEPTMNLDSFTMDTLDSEFFRVVRHETGHTIGCPHEHMRKAFIKRIDENKAIEFYGEDQGWTPMQVRQQVLTPLEEVSLMATPEADETSIMCYQIPSFITIDGKPIMGGKDINKTDYAFIGKLYPKPKKAAK